MSAHAAISMGVVVCCHNEERVLERRLRNLSLSSWPPAQRPHVVLLVDDGSNDRTSALARDLEQGLFPASVQFEVIANSLRPGKSGAIACALQRLHGRVDLIVLTDADVVHDPSALDVIARAFAQEPQLSMACGSQRFVSSLSMSGTLDPRLMHRRGDWYDGLTALVRRLESRSGRVFSVHGQLLAWRAALRLCPREGLAADDLDLMRQARLAGGRVQLLRDARFFEVKPKARGERWKQGLRRARAFVQFARTLEPSAAGDRCTRWQWRFYKHVPTAVPGVALLVLVPLIAMLCFSRVVLGQFEVFPLGSMGLFFASILSVSGVWRLCYLIHAAKRLEQAQTMDDRWTTAR
jgi:glycosyltransferase involved in cell wall biosynthesis